MTISTVVKMGYGTSISSVVSMGYIIAETISSDPGDGGSLPTRNTKSHLGLVDKRSGLNTLNIKSHIKEL